MANMGARIKSEDWNESARAEVVREVLCHLKIKIAGGFSERMQKRIRGGDKSLEANGRIKSNSNSISMEWVYVEKSRDLRVSERSKALANESR